MMNTQYDLQEFTFFAEQRYTEAWMQPVKLECVVQAYSGLEAVQAFRELHPTADLMVTVSRYVND